MLPQYAARKPLGHAKRLDNVFYAIPATPPRQKGREGKVSITQWVDPVVRKQIAQISLDEDKDQYELINEALNLLFEKYGRSTIA